MSIVGLLLLPVLLSLIGPDPVDVGAHAVAHGADKSHALEMGGPKPALDPKHNA